MDFSNNYPTTFGPNVAVMGITNAFLSQAKMPGEKVSVPLASDSEREEIYHLRHEVYASELGQHPQNGTATLRDALDAVNVYIVARVTGKLAGFISITPPGQPQYSIDKYFDRQALPFTVDEWLYEIRLLTVVRTHRGRELAVLLMYAAFRWVESHGGRQIVAIGRREILDLYLKVGLKIMGKAARCGSVTYDLLHGNVSDVRIKLQQFEGLLSRLECKTDWLNFTMHTPAPDRMNRWRDSSSRPRMQLSVSRCPKRTL